MDIVKKYTKIYFQLVNCAFSSYLSNRIDTLCYFLGKVVRFTFFILLVISIFRYTDTFGGYGMYEAILFFLTLVLVDFFGQFLFRGVYLFKRDVINGQFDYVLIKPLNKIFYIMNRLVDVLDLIFLLPIIGCLAYIFTVLWGKIGLGGLFLYVLFILNAIIIVFGIHIIVAGLSIKFYESENLIWLYRESMTIGRMPPEIYSAPVRFVFTFVMPVFIMAAFPAKAALGILSFRWALFAFFFSVFLVIFSLLFWQNSLRYYSSASS